MDFVITSAEWGRYRNYHTYVWLTSAWVVGPMIVGVIAVTALVVFNIFFSLPDGKFFGGLLVLGSGSAGALLVYVFGRTYYGHLVLPATLTKLLEQETAGEKVNLAEAASQETLGLLTPILAQDSIALRHVFDALLASSDVQTFFQRLRLEARDVRDAIVSVESGYRWAEIAYSTSTFANSLSSEVITPLHIVGRMLLQDGLRTFLRQHELAQQDIIFVVWWMLAEAEVRADAARWWTADKLLSFTGIGLSWTSGYTPLVDQFARFPRGNLWDQIIVGREAHVEQLINTLARQRQSNVLLVGQAGVGRLGVVMEVARRIRQNHAHPELNGQRVVYLHIGEILAREASNASQLAIVSRVLSEMERAGNVIAIIDGLGAILGEEGESRVNLTDILLPFFSSLAVRVVVIISAEEYNLRIRANEELGHFFEVVQIDNVSGEVALQVLALATPQLEQASGVYLPYTTLRAITRGTESILQQIPYPERAFDFLEEALALAQGKGWRELLPEHIDALISQKVGIPVGKLQEQERSRLLGLEDLMHERVVNQSPAIAAVARAMIRARAGVRNQARPVGTFLFLGPTGVGKTETAKTLAEAYFGSEEYMTRLDMSEFQTEESIGTLLGSHRQPVGRLTSLISEHPFTVLLLDEFEKAHTTIQQAFLQVFDEGRLTDARGTTLSFAHAIIIATSNAGAELIRAEVKDGQVPDNFSETLRDHILQKGIFKPELLNRFDGIITFTTLTRDHIEEVARRMLKKLNKRLDATHGVTVKITPELLEYLVLHGYNPEFGARPMARAIQDTVEYAVAQQVLRGTLEAGKEITLRPEMLEQLRVSAGK